MNSQEKLNRALSGGKTVLLWIRRTIIIFTVLFVIPAMVLNGLNGFKANANEISPTVTRQAERIADPVTANSWMKVFDSESSKQNGLIWSDLSFISYEEKFLQQASLTDYLSTDKSSDGTVESVITKTGNGSSNRIDWKTSRNGQLMEDYSMDLNEDFLAVFSVLGSTAKTVQSQPIDLVLVLDFSKSMLEQETIDGISQTRIERVLAETNKALSFLFDTSSLGSANNRAGVVVYGTRGEVLIPLDSYEATDDAYLSLGIDAQGKPSIKTSRLIRSDGSVYEKELNNDPATGIGPGTNLQAGIYSGLHILAEEENTLGRKPMVMIMSDGGANALCRGQEDTSNDLITAGSWIKPDPTRQWFASDSDENHAYDTGAAIIVSTLLTASLQNLWVERNYQTGLEAYAFGLEISPLSDGSKNDVYPWGIPRTRAILDPSAFFRADTAERFTAEYSDPMILENVSQVSQAYEIFRNFMDFNKDPFGEGPEVDYFIDTDVCFRLTFHTPLDDSNYQEGTNHLDITQKLTLNNFLEDDSLFELFTDVYDSDYELLGEDLEKCTYFIPEGNYYNLDFTNIEDCFVSILEQKLQSPYSPIDGTNIFGQQNVLTFANPLNPQFEVRNPVALHLFGQSYDIESVPVSVTGFGGEVVSQFRIILPESRNEFINPVYGNSQTIDVSQIYLWVEENETGNGSEKEQTLYFQIPAQALPVICSSLSQNGENWSLTSNYGESEALPLRLFYTCGVRSEYLNEAGAILDHAAASQGWNLSQYSSSRREDKNYRTGTEYLVSENGHGDAYTSFSPSWENGFYIHQHPSPLYQKAWYKSESGWREAGEDEIESKWLTVSVLDSYASAQDLPAEADTGILALSNPVIRADELLDKPGPFYLEENYLSNLNGQTVQVKKIRVEDQNSFSSSFNREKDETGYNDFLVYINPVSQAVSEAFSVTSDSVMPLENPGNSVVAVRSGGFKETKLHQKAVEKVQNLTQSAGTVSAAYMVDANPLGNSDPDTLHVLNFLGNNARITSVQESLIIGKRMAGSQFSDQSFEFELVSTELAGQSLSAHLLEWTGQTWKSAESLNVQTDESSGKNLALNSSGDFLTINPLSLSLDGLDDDSCLVSVLNDQVILSKSKGLIRADLLDSKGNSLVNGIILPVYEEQEGAMVPVIYTDSQNGEQSFVLTEGNSGGSEILLEFDETGKAEFDLYANQGVEIGQFPQNTSFTLSELQSNSGCYPAAIQDGYGNELKYTPSNEKTTVSIDNASGIDGEIIFINGSLLKSLENLKIKDGDVIASGDLLEYSIDWFASASSNGTIILEDILDENLIFQGAYLDGEAKTKKNGLLAENLAESSQFTVTEDSSQKFVITYSDYKKEGDLYLGGKVTWTFPVQTLETGTVYLDVKAAESDEELTITNQASMGNLKTNIVVNYLDPEAEPSVETEEPDLSIVKTQKIYGSYDPFTQEDLEVKPKDKLIYSVSFKNNSEFELTNVILWDPLPDGMKLLEETVTGKFDQIEVSDNKVEFLYESILPGQTEVVTFQAEVPQVSESRSWTNQAYLGFEGNGEEPLASNKVTSAYTVQNPAGGSSNSNVTSSPGITTGNTGSGYNTSAAPINTGRSSRMLFWLYLLVFSGCIFTGALFLIRHKKRVNR